LLFPVFVWILWFCAFTWVFLTVTWIQVSITQGSRSTTHTNWNTNIGYKHKNVFGISNLDGIYMIEYLPVLQVDGTRQTRSRKMKANPVTTTLSIITWRHSLTRTHSEHESANGFSTRFSRFYSFLKVFDSS
jgi:hypothetical protein